MTQPTHKRRQPYPRATQVMNVRIRDAEMERLREIARAEDRSLSSVVRLAVRVLLAERELSEQLAEPRAAAVQSPDEKARYKAAYEKAIAETKRALEDRPPAR